MAGTVWSKFFWSDWQAEPALRLCSYSARGLWMDMLCIAASHDPIGYVAVAGRGLEETDIARMTGGTESEVHALLGELDRNGVFSRDRKGTIYSRRMLKEARLSAEARKFGKEGGNPKLTTGYNKPGFIYLVGVRADGAYKIGISNDPAKRLTKIKAQYRGQDLQVIEAAPVTDMGRSEAELHEMFSAKKSGEWFFLNSVDVGKIKEIFRTLKGGEKSPLKPHKPLSNSQENKNGASALPDWLPLEAWSEFIEMRRRIRASLTPRAELLAIGVLSKLRSEGHDPRTVLEQSTMNSWRGLFPVKAEQGKSHGASIVKFEPTNLQGWRDRVRVFVEQSLWHPKNGPRPRESGCLVPAEILREFNLLDEVAA